MDASEQSPEKPLVGERDAREWSIDDEVLRQLQSIRESIDNVDAALIHMLAERFKFTQVVGRLKAAHGLPPADLEREARQIKRLRALAAEANLDPEFAEKFLNFIVAEVIHHHEKIASDTDAITLPRGS